MSNLIQHTVQLSPTISVEPPPPAELTPAEKRSRIGEAVSAAFDFLKRCLTQLCLLVGKIIVIPIMLSLMAITATLTAISILFSLPPQYSFSAAERQPRVSPFQHMVSVLDELREITLITLKLGIYKNGEELKKVDDNPDSPYYVLVRPDSKDEKSWKTPILYAPGYLDSPETLRDSCRRIAKLTNSPVYIVKYRSRFQSIVEHAKDVDRLAQRILKDTGSQKLILAGHSMGGLITGHYLALNPKRVKLWITIGTPLHGTPLARIGIGKCAAEMRRESEFLREFHERHALLRDLNQFHIYSLTDHIVPPTSAQRLDCPANHYRCTQPRGHLGVRSCNDVEQKLADAINGLEE